MPRRGNKRKLEKTAMDSVPCQIDRGSSCNEESPSVYLMVGNQISHPSYSVYEVKPFFPDGGSSTPRHIRRRLRPAANLYAKLSMSFVPVRSRLGSWIVGVGGDLAKKDYGPETIVFDTETRAVITGPKLVSTKFYPILLPFGDRIYALSQFPNVKEDLDFVPWFEVLDLSEAQVADGARLVNCEWKEMPRPPFFPWELTPRQYIVPPEVTVKSYVAVGSCFLVSVTGQTGTHMFDAKMEGWAKLDDEDLPFIGGAIPHGPLVFLGLSRASKKITAYKITVTKGKPSLSIVEFPVVTDWEVEEEVVSSSRFVSLGNHSFCSFNCRSIDRMPRPKYVGELVSMRAYTIQNPLSLSHLESIRNILVSNKQKRIYNIRDLFPGLDGPSLEAVISL